jgi:hypothetical protein
VVSARYQIAPALSLPMPMPVTVEPSQVGLVPNDAQWTSTPDQKSISRQPKVRVGQLKSWRKHHPFDESRRPSGIITRCSATDTTDLPPWWSPGPVDPPAPHRPPSARQAPRRMRTVTTGHRMTTPRRVAWQRVTPLRQDAGVCHDLSTVRTLSTVRPGPDHHHAPERPHE